ncbi:MAG: hypothetical protein AVDCRST_MAG13-2392, partial [uncultured Solirubrobacteraceae bacterium]
PRRPRRRRGAPRGREGPLLAGRVLEPPDDPPRRPRPRHGPPALHRRAPGRPPRPAPGSRGRPLGHRRARRHERLGPLPPALHAAPAREPRHAGRLPRRRHHHRDGPAALAGERLPAGARLVVRPRPVRRLAGVRRDALARHARGRPQAPAVRHEGHVPPSRAHRPRARGRPRPVRRRPRVRPDGGHEGPAALRRHGHGPGHQV